MLIIGEREMKMQTGYDVFGKAYGVMLRNDLHAPGSIDRKLMQNMVLLNGQSYDSLYQPSIVLLDMHTHELYEFAQSFQGKSSRQTVQNIVRYCSDIALNYNVPFEQMLFGGTEKEILQRGTDWCADMARVGVVLLMCCGIPTRIVNLANPAKAYHGHAVVEAFYEGKYGVCDLIYGYCFYDKRPLGAYELIHNKAYLSAYSKDYAQLYSMAAISQYNPLEQHCYQVSGPNAYYLRLINTNHQGKWLMGENEGESGDIPID